MTGFLIEPHPQTHPSESEATDDDERHLPTPSTSQQRNGGRSCQRTHRGTAVEDRGGEGTVLLREILCRSLDGSREVTCLTDSQDQTAAQEEPYGDGGDGNGGIAASLHHAKRLDGVVTLDGHSHPAATCVEHGTERPNEDSDKIAFLRAHPVDELAGEEVRNGIEQGEQSGNRTVVAVGPVELRGDKVLPG